MADLDDSHPDTALPTEEADALIEASSPHTAPGAIAKSPWKLPRAAWWQVLKRVWLMAGFHNLNILAAGVAFFTFLAITPLIASTVMVYGLIGDPAMVERQMASLMDVVPADVAGLIGEQMLAVVNANDGVTGLALVIALALALFGGQRAASGMIAALNVINEEFETRNILKLFARAILLTLAAVGIALAGLVGGSVFAWLRTQTADLIGPGTKDVFQIITWATAFVLGTLGFMTIMRYAPDRSPAQWRWLLPGALLSTFLWIAVSFGFSIYVAFVSDYSATYGSLSAVVVFLMWLFLSAYAILIGALVNAEAERQTRKDSTHGPERPMGQRGAVLADTDLVALHKRAIEQKKEQRRARHAQREAEGEQA